jgi:hypothetical protein
MVRGESSSVALARLCETDIELRWMCGDAQVKKSTLSDFRKRHVEELADLSTQVLAALARSGMLPGEELAVDGTVIRAAASCSANCTRKELRSRVERLSEAIDSKLAEAEVEPQRVERLAQRRARFQRALAEMERLGLKEDGQRMTLTEPQATVKKLKGGGFAPAHNVQAVTDLSGGAIITTDVVEQNSDQGQLEPQVSKAREELERVRALVSAQRAQECTVRSVTADAAYHDTGQLVALEGEIETFVPDGQIKRRPRGVSEPFVAEAFSYDADSDTMICPQGHALRRRKLNRGRTAVTYQGEARVCKACPCKPQCCPRSKGGRSVNRPLYAHVTDAVAQRVRSERGKRCRMARMVVMEGVFARTVELLNWRRCRAWGKTGAQAEALWRQITHNLMLLLGQWKPLVLQQVAGG